MKPMFRAFALLLLPVMLQSQSGSINNTLGTGGSFNIKDGSTTFFSLTQSDGKLSLGKTITLPVTTGSSVGVILKGSASFIHDFQAPGTNGGNTFVGVNAGNFTMSGTAQAQASHNTAVGNSSLSSNTTGGANSAFGSSSLMYNTTGGGNSAFGSYSLMYNTTGDGNAAFGYTSLGQNTSGSNNSAFGYFSLDYNATGHSNSAFGYYSLYANTTGYSNSAFGSSSLMYNTTGYANAAFGSYSLFANTTGINNSAFGYESLYSNTTGGSNSSFGYGSLYANTTGAGNCSFGTNSLRSNTTGRSNSAFGFLSLYDNTAGSGNSGFGNYAVRYSTGSFNTAVGDSAGVNITSGSNNTAIGYNAQVPTATSNNQVRIGNTSVTYAGVQVAWTVTSDRRWKSNVSSTDLGLDFVSKLNPVSYSRRNDEKQRTEYGFIAQEIEEVLKQSGVKNAGMLTVDDEGRYELRYNDLLAPIVKALQELKAENDALKAKVLKLEGAYAVSTHKTKDDISGQPTSHFQQ